VPQPLDRERRYLPGLDGLRALAVAAVVLYHLGYPWAAGGFLGVSVFFTLSGYLITDLILGQGDRFRFRGFWIGRARRLLPGLAAMLLVVTVWVAIRGWPSGYTSALVGAALYASNWQLVAQHVSYFARFGPPTPLQHLWSLGVEEQFYLAWPLLLIVLAKLVPERRAGSSARPRLALVTLALAAASAFELRLLYHPGFDTSRVYYGTDTRASELLVGAALAMLWPTRRLRPRATLGAKRVLDLVTIGGVALVAYVAWTVDEYSPFVYRGGIVLVTVGTALAVLGLAHPAARVGRVLGWSPLRWIGVRSYGIYLWHLPVILLTTPAGQHRPQLTRSVLQVAAIVALAALSWRFVEEPLRARRRPSLRRRDRLQLAGVLVPVLALAGIAVLGLAMTSNSTTRAPKPTVVHPATPVVLHRHPVKPSTHTSCTAVIHIGDSTSEGLTSTNYLPNPIQRMDSRYRQVGVHTMHFEISGARSIVETYEDQPNAADVVRAWKSAGYHGCWVLALGTNDTADVAVGSHVGRLDRVKQMMSLIGRHDPVLWVDVKSLVDTGPYAEANMRLWNSALRSACAGHPNLRIYDWASAVKDKWFIADGIHFNTPGYAARALLIAHGLAVAFPARGGPSPCVVS